MERNGVLIGKDAWFACVLAALTMAAMAPLSALGADRVVLGEEFSATW